MHSSANHVKIKENEQGRHGTLDEKMSMASQSKPDKHALLLSQSFAPPPSAFRVAHFSPTIHFN